MPYWFRLIAALAAGLSRPWRTKSGVSASLAVNGGALEAPSRMDSPQAADWRNNVDTDAEIMIENGRISHIIQEIISENLSVNIFDVAIICVIAISVEPRIDLSAMNMKSEIKLIEGMDSLHSFEFVEFLERYFGVALPDEIFEHVEPERRGIKTIYDLSKTLLSARLT